MSVSFEVSSELASYGAQIREWGLSEVRPFARQADTDHEVPAAAYAALDSAPVPIGRLGRPGDDLPSMKEGYDVVRNVWYENVIYADAWLLHALNRGIGHQVVQASGTAEQIERYYEPVVRDGVRSGFGLSEPEAGSDTANLKTTATRDGDSWVINGTKMYCSLGALAEYTIVFATVDRSQGAQGIRAFIVENSTPGVSVLKANEDKLGLRCWVTSQLAFDDCVIPLENIVGGVGADGSIASAGGLRAGLAQLSRNRPNVAAMAIGLGTAALDLTTPLLRADRRSFAPHRWAIIEAELAQMHASLNRARLLGLRALWLASAGRANRFEATAAKAYGPQNAEQIILRCMQLLGPVGASQELLLEKWYRDVKIMDIFEGTGQIMRLLLSRELMGRSAGSA